MKNSGKILLILGCAVLFFLFFYFDLGKFLTLEYMKSQQDYFSQSYAQNPFLTILIFSLIYIFSTALSLPGAAILTLLGGALFGVVNGTLIVSFASTIGATFAFLSSRYLLRDWVQSQFGQHLDKINKGIETEGAFYLFTLRVMPVFPFFVVNLVMGLTSIKMMTYYWVSQVGMLAGTVVYVNAGTQLSQIDSLKGIVSPSLILSFFLLALFPLLSKKIIGMIKNRKN